MSEAAVERGAELVLVRYGELALKGGNRGEFERALVHNIRVATASISPVRVERERGRMFVWPEQRLELVARRLQEVFGIASISPAWRCEPSYEALVRSSELVLREALSELPPQAPVRFRVKSSRSEKRFPMTSVELDRQLGGVALGAFPRLIVDLEEPELVLGVDVRTDAAYVFARKLRGAGGLPVGTLGHALCLISGGIDSPVASWMAMKRGLALSFVTFHSFPYIGDAAKKKVVDLVRVLARWQSQPSRLWVVPFAEAQLAIKGAPYPAYRTVLYRRMMQRIASSLAHSQRAGALVTGECLGQVASQTLENLTCIQAAADLPVLRPLVSFDKEETMALARRIGTLEISELQEPDCCTLFMPEHPVIRGRIATCLESEARFDVEAIRIDAVARAELVTIEPEA